jgi:hypothetical protein
VNNIKLRDSNRNRHQSGDIILTKSTGKISTINIVAQSTVSLIRADYTHALLCLGSGRFVEATFGEKLFSFHYLDESRISLNSEEWKVIRNKDFSSIDNEDFFKTVSIHLGKNYLLKDIESKTFCSAFIALVYNDLFTGIFEKPAKVLPVDLQNLVIDSDSWEDVTHEYKSELIGAPSITDEVIINTTDFFNFIYSHSETTVSQLKIVDDIERTVKRIQKSTGLDISPKLTSINEEDTKDYINWKMKKYQKEKVRKRKK